MKTHQREFQFPKLFFIAESERHNPTPGAPSSCSVPEPCSTTVSCPYLLDLGVFMASPQWAALRF